MIRWYVLKIVICPVMAEPLHVQHSLLVAFPQPPLEEDIAALKRLDPTFVALMHDERKQEHDERQAAAQQDANVADEGSYNPWDVSNGSDEVTG